MSDYAGDIDPREPFSDVNGQPYPFKDALANWFEGSPTQARITVALVLLFYLIALVFSSINVHFAEQRDSGDTNRDAALVFSSVGIASSLFGLWYMGASWFSYDTRMRISARQKWNTVRNATSRGWNKLRKLRYNG